MATNGSQVNKLWAKQTTPSAGNAEENCLRLIQAAITDQKNIVGDHIRVGLGLCRSTLYCKNLGLASKSIKTWQ